MFNKVPYPLTRYASSLGFACLRPESVPQPRGRPEAFFAEENYCQGIFSAKPEGLECGGFGSAVIFSEGASRGEDDYSD